MSDESFRADLAKLSYELSLASLAEQERVVSELRARSGTLLAASSIVASFFGARAVGDRRVAWLGLAATVAFTTSIASSLVVLLPKRRLIFALRGSAAFDTLLVIDDLAEALRRLSHWLDRYRDGNQSTVERMHRAYWLATASVLTEVVLWGAEVLP